MFICILSASQKLLTYTTDQMFGICMISFFIYLIKYVKYYYNLNEWFLY